MLVSWLALAVTLSWWLRLGFPGCSRSNWPQQDSLEARMDCRSLLFSPCAAPPSHHKQLKHTRGKKGHMAFQRQILTYMWICVALQWHTITQSRKVTDCSKISVFLDIWKNKFWKSYFQDKMHKAAVLFFFGFFKQQFYQFIEEWHTTLIFIIYIFTSSHLANVFIWRAQTAMKY